MAKFRLTVSREDLLAALKIPATAVGTGRNTMPVLEMVRLTAARSVLTIEATDMEIYAQISLDCSHDSSGIALLPMADMMRGLKAMSDQAVTITKDGGDGLATVTCGGVSLQLTSLDEADFPDYRCNDLGEAIRFNIDSDLLADTLKRVQTAVSTEKTRYYLNGQLWRITQAGDLVAVATDGHRLIRVRLEDGEFSELSYPMFRRDDYQRGAILPRAFTSCLAKILPVKKKACPVHVEIAELRARVTFGRAVITSKTIDGTFPEYERVIPSSHSATMTVSRQIFLSSVASVASVSKEPSLPVKFTPGRGALKLAAERPDGGWAQTQCPAEFSGDPMREIRFQVRYLQDAVDKVYHAAPDVEFRFGDANEAPTAIYNPARPEDVTVFVPMRV